MPSLLCPRVSVLTRVISMRALSLCTLATLASLVSGCGQSRTYDGPTVDAFTGRLTVQGNPISFKEEQKPKLRLIHHKKGERFGIPIQPDGTFKIGWMPIGKYSAILETFRSGKRTTVNTHTIESGLTIEKGKTEYVIEVGKGYKP